MTAQVETRHCKEKFCQSCLDQALKYSCYYPMCKVALKVTNLLVSHSFTIGKQANIPNGPKHPNLSEQSYSI